MIHMGIDHHKKYSYVVALNDSNQILWQGKMSNEPEAFKNLKESLPVQEPVQSVLEAGRNWGPLYDLLEELELDPHLANPYKSRLIAETYKKTDKLDAQTQAWMLKAGITPLVHVPSPEIRNQKNLLRQRLWLVKIQTALKNRIHNLIDRNHFKAPETDLFRSRGQAWMRSLDLKEPDRQLLDMDLELLNQIQTHIRETEQWIEQALKDNPLIPILKSLPGVGSFFAALIALEIGNAQRFARPEKLCSYAGLVNSTYSSGGKTFHGKLIPTCNHYLRYAFIEAAWTAVRASPYFQAFYQRLKFKKGSQTAIAATARKLCEISFYCIQNNRTYVERPYKFHSQSGRPGHFLACR